MTESEQRAVEDVVAPGLQVLFCGINPGLASARAGHHFAHPGNRFWKALHRSGFTPTQLTPAAERRLLAYGLGVTNLVERPTPSAADVEREELRHGATALAEKVRRLQPRAVAVLGLGAFRVAFAHAQADGRPQPAGPEVNRTISASLHDRCALSWRRTSVGRRKNVEDAASTSLPLGR